MIYNFPKAALFFAIIVSFSVLLPTTAKADNKDYCVYAKAGIGFVIEAHWFNNDGTELRSDNIPVFQWSCAPDDATAVGLNVYGADIGTKAIQAVLLGATGVTAAVACVGTVGAGCPAAAALAGTTAGVIIAEIPSPEGVFLKAQLSEPEYIEVWGTMWAPQVFFNGKKCSGC